ncbi:hypothetical protein [Luteibacter sahnii]|uniref:hypothetical protein n=1 Tax=Luteibacter sahnii TaxID=3021977 RepID=UPI002A6B5018|nr:hypothetical protein [Luteibacter sp. PPL193]MDY1547321.1 hypothetical protein [Luteibacter sp. PPL193]
MPYRPLACIALATLLVAGAAQASPQASAGLDTGAPSFADLSKDGKPLRRSDLPKDNEALRELRAHFGEADKDHNGSLDKSEYDAYIHKADAQKQN